MMGTAPPEWGDGTTCAARTTEACSTKLTARGCVDDETRSAAATTTSTRCPSHGHKGRTSVASSSRLESGLDAEWDWLAPPDLGHLASCPASRGSLDVLVDEGAELTCLCNRALELELAGEAEPGAAAAAPAASSPQPPPGPEDGFDDGLRAGFYQLHSGPFGLNLDPACDGDSAGNCLDERVTSLDLLPLITATDQVLTREVSADALDMVEGCLLGGHPASQCDFFSPSPAGASYKDAPRFGVPQCYRAALRGTRALPSAAPAKPRLPFGKDQLDREEGLAAGHLSGAPARSLLRSRPSSSASS